MSGRSYHVTNKRPKSYPDMLDDVTSEPLYQRPDDTPEALK